VQSSDWEPELFSSSNTSLLMCLVAQRAKQHLLSSPHTAKLLPVPGSRQDKVNISRAVKKELRALTSL